MSNLVLYSYWRSSCSYRVRVALNFKGLDYEYRDVHLVRDGGEQHQEAYRKLNPMGQVPCLITPDGALNQSMAIMEYLELVKPEPSLFPGNPYQACRIRAVCESINAGIQPLQNLNVLQDLKTRYGVDQDGVAEWVAHWIAKGLDAVEKEVAPHAGRFCFGDQVTAADMFLAPQVYNAVRFKVDMAQFPTLSRINEACLKQSVFIDAEPSRQPDAAPA